MFQFTTVNKKAKVLSFPGGYSQITAS